MLQRLLLTSSLVAAVGCTTAPRAQHDSVRDPGTSLDGLAARLVETAELRGDARTMRVCIPPLEARASDGRTPATSPELVGLGKALERELVFALSDRLRLLDQEVGSAGDDLDVDALVARTGATHAVLGQFVRTPRELLVWVRLVDAESGLIVATAQDRLPVEPYLERGLAWAGDPLPVSTAAIEPVPSEPDPAPAATKAAAAERVAQETPERGPSEPGPAGPTTTTTSTQAAASDPAGPSVRYTPPKEPLADAEEVALPAQPPLDVVADAELPEELPQVDGPASRRFRRLDSDRGKKKD